MEMIRKQSRRGVAGNRCCPGIHQRHDKASRQIREEAQPEIHQGISSEIYERLVKFHECLSREDGSLNRELFQEVEEDADDLEGFLLERIFSLPAAASWTKR